MRGALVLLLTLLCSVPVFAGDSYNETWTQANTAYQKKDYDKAAKLYEHLAAGKPGEAEIYYNLGNAYYKLNKIGPAVLNYRRALKMDPGYQAAKDNLELTESRIPNRVQESQDIFFVEWWKSITNAQLAEVWAVVSLVLFLLCMTILVLRRLQKAPGWMSARMATIGLLICAPLLTFGYVAGARKASNSRAVVMNHDAPLVESGVKTKPQSLIPEGTVVTISAENADMLEVTLPDGRKGWMNKQLLQRI